MGAHLLLEWGKGQFIQDEGGVLVFVVLAALVSVWGSPLLPSVANEEGPVEQFLCDFCKWMVGEIEMLLEQGKTEEDVIKALLGLCDQAGDLVPGIDLAETCKNFVNTYAKPAIDIIIIDTQPDHVCGALDVCEASSTAIPTTMPTTKKDTTTMPPETTTSS